MNSNLFDQLLGHHSDLSRPLLWDEMDTLVTYGAAIEAANRYANALVLLGVEPGDRVAVQIEKSPQAVFLYLACLRSGAVYLPLNTAYTSSEIGYFVGDAEPKLLVVDPSRLGELSSAMGRFDGLQIKSLSANGGSLHELAIQQASEFTSVPREPTDLAAILYTSGTTGRAKGAMLTQNNLASNALTLIDAWQISASDVLLHALPIFHTHGLFVALNTSLLAGGAMRFLPRFDGDLVMAHLPHSNVMMGVPTFYTRLLARPDFDHRAAAHMRLFISGSAPLSAETHREFQDRTGQAILERYGMTETNMNTSNPYDGERRAGTVGFPLPGIEARIADPETGEPLADGEVGGIEVRGPNVFAGYWRMPDKTASEFRSDGFFITGDMGRIGENGYISIVGRSKDLIISGGFNVYPAEVEAVLDAHNDIAETAIIGLPHPDFGEAVTAVVAARNGAVVDEAEIRQAASDVLAKYKIPKRVLVVDALPRNAMGKIQKNALRDEYANLYVRAGNN